MKPGYKQTEVGVIPEEWEVKRLGQLSAFITSGSRGWAAFYSEAGALFVRSQNVRDGRLSFEDTQYVRPPRGAEGDRTKMALNDILITITGNSVGNVAVVEHQFGEAYISQHVGLVRLSEAESGGYICRFLSPNSPGNNQISGSQSGQSKPGLNLQNLRDFWIALPPTKAEQRAIAEALSDVDGLLSGLDRLIAKKGDLKQAAMQQLLTGQTRLPGFHGEWEAKTLGTCLLSRPDYGINAAAVPYSDKFPSYIRITDISEHGRFCPDPRVSVKAASANQYYLQGGDIVFARTGASVGKSYLYLPRDGELVFAGFLIRVRPNPALLVPAFLAAYATTKPYWNWVRLMSMRSGQPGINGNEYAQLPLSLPRLLEQTTIAEVLTDMDAELAALERRREKTRALKQAMMQELLTGRTRLV